MALDRACLLVGGAPEFSTEADGVAVYEWGLGGDCHVSGVCGFAVRGRGVGCLC